MRDSGDCCGAMASDANVLAARKKLPMFSLSLVLQPWSSRCAGAGGSSGVADWVVVDVALAVVGHLQCSGGEGGVKWTCVRGRSGSDQ